MPWSFAGNRALLIAHRGAAMDAPENTAAAIRLAFRQGAHLVELDVQLTRDKRLVIFHDDRLERTSTGRGRLASWLYRDLRRLDTGVWFASRFAGERPLLVSQALTMCPPACGVNLELKATSHAADLIARLIRCLRWTRMRRRVLVSSFDGDLLARLKAAAPSVPRALLCARRPWQALRRAIALECVAFHPHHTVTTPALIQQAHGHGLRVHLWTVDAPGEAKRILRMGADGLVTNVPRRLRGILQGRS